VEDDVLSFSAERTQNEEEKKKGYRRVERSWGCLNRSFTVCENVDAYKIEAIYDNGVLTIKVPKNDPQTKTGREIQVK